MNSNLDTISKDTIIESINDLMNSMRMVKRLEINMSKGKLVHIDEDRVCIEGKGYHSNQPITHLSKEDLILVLRYLQNMRKCMDITLSEIKYSEIYNTISKTWRKVPYNKSEVKAKIKDFLSKKKNIATCRKY